MLITTAKMGRFSLTVDYLTGFRWGAKPTLGQNSPGWAIDLGPLHIQISSFLKKSHNQKDPHDTPAESARKDRRPVP